MRALVVCSFLVAACGSSPVDPVPDAATRDDAAVVEDGGTPEALCARESSESLDGTSIVVCEEAYASAPLVRAPADTEADGARVVHGGIARRADGTLAFVGRGVHYDIATPAPAWLMAESMYENVRYGHLLYAATVRDGVIESVAPIARIDDRVFQRLLAGLVFEGIVSAREIGADGEVRWAFEDLTVPLRIRMDEMPEEVARDGSGGFPRHAILGRIENLRDPVRSSDGRCLASLRSLGDGDPFATGADDVVVVLRHASMHGGFDDVFTMDWPAGTTISNNMGAGLFVSVASLIQSEAPAPTDAGSHPHAVPWGGPSTDLDVVTGGGEPCAP